MNIFAILPDKINWGKSYNDNIVARRAWSLPGIQCSECGNTWATIGVDYPLVNLSFLSTDILKTFRARAAPVEEYIKLRDLVAPLISPGLPLPPGTGLGPLKGKGTGKCGDFAWPDLWTLLVKQNTYLILQSKDLRLPKVAIPQLIVKENSGCDLFEFQIEPRASLALASYNSPEPRICSSCGRDERKVEKHIVDRRSIPSDVDIFRIIDFPTYILVTERFRDIVNQLNLTNVRFLDIEIA